MSQNFSEIIAILENVDDLFKKIENREDEANKLWEEGIERLAAAIWICERKEESEAAP
jgi:phosphate uptake regulator